jgi:hypothetical protein
MQLKTWESQSIRIPRYIITRILIILTSAQLVEFMNSNELHEYSLQADPRDLALLEFL